MKEKGQEKKEKGINKRKNMKVTLLTVQMSLSKLVFIPRKHLH